jgi:putative Mg2+ transporter-C (MgtC) family protein
MMSLATVLVFRGSGSCHHSVAWHGEHPDAASRVIQGVIQGLMAGISFIGAGVILLSRQDMQGLTTAATVWVTAALGIACGFAMWRTADTAVAIALMLLVLVSRIERALAKAK